VKLFSPRVTAMDQTIKDACLGSRTRRRHHFGGDITSEEHHFGNEIDEQIIKEGSMVMFSEEAEWVRTATGLTRAFVTLAWS